MTLAFAEVTFRDARPGDEHIVARHVRGIAEVEGVVHKVTATPAHYAALLFGAAAPLRGVLAEDDAGVIASVLWYPIVGTFSGQSGLRIEDVFVEPACRGQGLGRRLFAEMARRALLAGHSWLQWSVKDDNVAAIAFYDRLGAETVSGLVTRRMQGAELAALAAAEPGSERGVG